MNSVFNDYANENSERHYRGKQTDSLIHYALMVLAMVIVLLASVACPGCDEQTPPGKCDNPFFVIVQGGASLLTGEIFE